MCEHIQMQFIWETTLHQVPPVSSSVIYLKDNFQPSTQKKEKILPDFTNCSHHPFPYLTCFFPGSWPISATHCSTHVVPVPGCKVGSLSAGISWQLPVPSSEVQPITSPAQALCPKAPRTISSGSAKSHSAPS